MTRFGKELIESMTQAVKYATGDKAREKIRPHRRSFATAELSEEAARAIGSSQMDERHLDIERMLTEQEDKARKAD